nr:MAG TPA: hypothetical protein [Caudoviricetes sp.]
MSRTFFKCFLIPLRIGTNFEKIVSKPLDKHNMLWYN